MWCFTAYRALLWKLSLVILPCKPQLGTVVLEHHGWVERAWAHISLGSHFTAEKTEPPRDWINCSRSYSHEVLIQDSFYRFVDHLKDNILHVLIIYMSIYVMLPRLTESLQLQKPIIFWSPSPKEVRMTTSQFSMNY